MREGTFLGYKVDADELRVCSDKVEAVLDLPSPKCLKDVQKLNGKLVSLNRVLSKSVEKSLTFFQTLKKYTKKSDFQWTAKAEVTFKEMKQLIAELPMLTAPSEKEELIMYLAATKEAINAVLMTERDGKQVPNYFVSRALQGLEINYTSMKKLILALVSAGKQLKRYFQALIIVVITDQPIKQLLSNPDVKAAQMEIQTRRARHSVPTTDVSKRTNSGGLRRGASGGRHTRYINGGQGRTPRPMDIIHGRIIMHRCPDNWSLNNRENGSTKSPSKCGLKTRSQPAGPFLEGPGKVKFLIVAMDYFTKWIEARPVATITGDQVKKDNPFKDWCEKLSIHQCFASVKHPQANGLVERAKRSLGEGIKARLRDKNKIWVEEISHVLWAHRTMIKSSNRETPFSLTYGAEAVIPAEIGMPTLRSAEVDMIKNNKALGISLDLLEEKREQAPVQEARSKAKMKRYYNVWVRNTSFRPRDFVYQNNEASHAEDGDKLGSKWEGPYEVTEALGKGAYRFRDRNGHTLPRTWNICNLKKYYMHEM
nr:reverse transcriptase domain-containing protein [Tanacetum cinerariifolium]